jgi:hypothetical protein
MNRQRSAQRLLRRSALAGYGAMAGGAALTVALIAGVVHTASQAASSPAGSTGSTGATSTDSGSTDSGSTDDSTAIPSDSGSTSVNTPQQNTTVNGGSHGS